MATTIGVPSTLGTRFGGAPAVLTTADWNVNWLREREPAFVICLNYDSLARAPRAG